MQEGDTDWGVGYWEILGLCMAVLGPKLAGFRAFLGDKLREKDPLGVTPADFGGRDYDFFFFFLFFALGWFGSVNKFTLILVSPEGSFFFELVFFERYFCKSVALCVPRPFSRSPSLFSTRLDSLSDPDQGDQDCFFLACLVRVLSSFLKPLFKSCSCFCTISLNCLSWASLRPLDSETRRFCSSVCQGTPVLRSGCF